jgi:hypothetical protein
MRNYFISRYIYGRFNNILHVKKVSPYRTLLSFSFDRLSIRAVVVKCI